MYLNKIFTGINTVSSGGCHKTHIHLQTTKPFTITCWNDLPFHTRTLTTLLALRIANVLPKTNKLFYHVNGKENILY